MKSTLPKGARILLPAEVVSVADWSKWSQSKRDPWTEIRPGSMLLGLPVATLRERHGQSEMQFATFRKS